MPDAPTATRLRRVCNALNLMSAIPDDDLALYRSMFSILGIIARKEEDQAETIAHLQLENAKLRNALQLLQDNQNGCPLPKYEIDWNEAMRLSYELLGETK